MGTRSVLQAFEKYQKERVAFVTSVAEMAKSPQVSDPLRLTHAGFDSAKTHTYLCSPKFLRFSDSFLDLNIIDILLVLEFNGAVMIPSPDYFYNCLNYVFCLQNVEALQQAGAMALLRPLLLDNVPR